MATTERYFYGTGRRKTSVARVRLYPGSGEILINGKGYLEVFTRGGHQNAVLGKRRNWLPRPRRASRWAIASSPVAG